MNSNRTKSYLPRLWYFLPFVIILVVWEVISLMRIMPSAIMPSPLSTYLALLSFATAGTLFKSMAATMERVLESLAIAIPGGVIMGLIMGWKKWVYRLFIVMFMMVFAIPKLAFYSIFLFFFGVSNTPIVLVATMSAFFGMLFPTIAGVRSMDKSFIRVAKDYDARDIQVFFKVLVPNSVPSLAAGVKFAITLSFIEVITAEMFHVAPGGLGLGWLVQLSAIYNQPSSVMAALLLILALGGLTVIFAEFVERRLGGWRR